MNTQLNTNLERTLNALPVIAIFSLVVFFVVSGTFA